MAEVDFTTSSDGDVRPAAAMPQAVRNIADVNGVLQFLWDKASDRLNDEDLEWLKGTGELASMMARQLSGTVEGIACLVANDSEVTGAGSFRSTHDLPDLLFVIANHTALIGRMAYIGSEVEAIPRLRRYGMHSADAE